MINFLPILIILVASSAVYLFLDYIKLRIIKFRRLENNPYGLWEIAFSPDKLFEKLDGEQAEVLMPAKPLIVRWCRKFFPLTVIHIEVLEGSHDLHN